MSKSLMGSILQNQRRTDFHGEANLLPRANITSTRTPAEAPVGATNAAYTAFVKLLGCIPPLHKLPLGMRVFLLAAIFIVWCVGLSTFSIAAADGPCSSSMGCSVCSLDDGGMCWLEEGRVGKFEAQMRAAIMKGSQLPDAKSHQPLDPLTPTEEVAYSAVNARATADQHTIAHARALVGTHVASVQRKNVHEKEFDLAATNSSR